eukprot:1982596-Rhodomonas_salina.1
MITSTTRVSPQLVLVVLACLAHAMVLLPVMPKRATVTNERFSDLEIGARRAREGTTARLRRLGRWVKRERSHASGWCWRQE